MGVLLLAGVRIPTPRALRAFNGGMGGAFFTGLLLSLIISPCGTPALAAILSFAAYKGSEAFGALMRFAYGIGNGLALLVVGRSRGSDAPRGRHVRICGPRPRAVRGNALEPEWGRGPMMQGCGNWSAMCCSTMMHDGCCSGMRSGGMMHEQDCCAH